jgi:hypothetical protein
MTNKQVELSSWEENTEHYPSTPDWPLIIGTAFMIGFGMVALIVML